MAQQVSLIHTHCKATKKTRMPSTKNNLSSYLTLTTLVLSVALTTTSSLEAATGGDNNVEESSKILTSSSWLDLEEAPTEKQQPLQKIVKMYHDLILECQVSGSPPPEKILWLKNGQPLQNNLKTAHEDFNHEIMEQLDASNFNMANIVAKLPLYCLDEGDAAEYTCIVHSDRGGKEIIMTTNVVVSKEDTTSNPQVVERTLHSCPPKLSLNLGFEKFLGGTPTPAIILKSQSLHMAVRGSRVILPCQVGGWPRPKVSWMDGQGQPVLPSKEFQIDSKGNLLIGKLKWSMMGEYSCLAENEFGKDSASTFLYPLTAKSHDKGEGRQQEAN